VRRRPDLSGQSGQAITEAVLILVMLFGFTFMVANYFKKQEVLKQLVSGPFAYLAGMLQNGEWATPEQGAPMHPTSHARHMAIEGEKAQ
jgi:hypothetical protein